MEVYEVKIKKTGEVIKATKQKGLDNQDYFQRIGGKLWFHFSEVLVTKRLLGEVME